MKSMSKQRFSVILNDEAANRVRQWYDDIDISNLSTADVVVSYFFNDSKTIELLMNGYREMASLNQEITKAFTPCEEEADICFLNSLQVLDNSTLG